MKQQAEFINSEKLKSLEYLKKESVELSLTCCGYEECNAGCHFSPYKRNDYMLYIVSEGKCTCEIDNKVYTLEKNDTLLIFPKTECSFHVGMEEAFSYMWIGFTGIKAEECVVYLGFSQKMPIYSIGDTKIIYDLIHHMIEIREMTFANALKRNGLLQIFFSDLIHHYNEQMMGKQFRYSRNGGEVSAYIRKAITYIADNYHSKVKIDELADYVGVNRSYFASSFKKATGYSPKEYLLNLRMEKAKTMLEKTDMPINAIANSVGYTDQLAFSRMFKRYSGMSPRAYREEKQK